MFENRKAGLKSSGGYGAAVVLFAVVWLLFFGVPCAAEMTPKEILRQADEARGNLEGVEWKVSILSKEEEREQDRDIEVQARGYDFLATLQSPPRVKGQKILMVDHNMWFTKPGVKKPVPISPRQKLVGGAAYGDIAATNYSDDYSASPLPDESVGGELCYVFDLKAVTKNATYDRITYWVSKKRVVGVKALYYTISGKLLKSAVFDYEYTLVSGKEHRFFISKMTIQDALVQTNVTVLCFSLPTLKEVPASTFDLNLLMMQ